MKKFVYNESFREIKIVAFCLLILSFAMAFSQGYSINAYASPNAVSIPSGVASAVTTGNAFADTSVANSFSRTVSTGINPILTLTALAVRSGASKGVITFLIILAAIEVSLRLFRETNILCAATIGKIEHVIGVVVAFTPILLNFPTVTAYASEALVTPEMSSIINTSIMTVVSFAISFLSYIVFFVIRVLIKALEAIGFLFALIPGGFLVTQVVKYGISLLYVLSSILSPETAALIGVMLLLVAVLIFKRARRLERYFRRIYIVPFIRSIFARNKQWPLVTDKAPTYIRMQFPNATFCQEAFVIRGVGTIPKREQVYLVCDNEGTYLCRKPFLKKWTIIRFQMEKLYGERRIRFLRIFAKDMICKKCSVQLNDSAEFCNKCGAKAKTKKASVEIVLRKELNNNYNEVKKVCGFQEAESSQGKGILQYI